METEYLNYHEISKKLLGPIEPIGDTNFDEQAYANLENTIYLVEYLIDDIVEVSSNNVSQVHSMKKSGVRALRCIRSIVSELEENLETEA